MFLCFFSADVGSQRQRAVTCARFSAQGSRGAKEWMESAQEKLAGIKHQLSQILGHYLHDDNPAIFALRDQVIDILKDLGLVWTQRVSSKFVVAHPGNRYGDGIVPQHVHNLVHKFSEHAFSIQEFGTPVATQVPPAENPRHAVVKEFNEKLVQDSMGFLPACQEEDYCIMSVAKSHSSMASRCVLKGVPDHGCDLSGPRLDENGYLSLDRIKKCCPSYAEYIEHGFPWLVVHWAVEEQYPGLVDLLMESGNLAQQQAMDETRIQLALKMQHASERLVSQEKCKFDAGTTHMTTDQIWLAVRREALRGSPKFRTEIDDLMNYVKTMAGSGGTLLKDIVGFAKTLKVPAIVHGEVLSAVGAAPWGDDGHGCIRFRQDMIKAALSASPKYQQDGVQTLIDTSVVSRLKNVSMVVQADKMKARAVSLLDEQGITASSAPIQTVLNIFGIRMVHHVIKKADPTRGTFQSLKEIGNAFTKEIANVSGKPFASPWVIEESGPKQSTLAAPMLKKWANDSADRETLFDGRGLKVGVCLVHARADDKQKLVINEIDHADKVVLAPVGGGDAKIVDAGAFLKAFEMGEYKLTRADEEAKYLENWSLSANPQNAFSWKSLVLIGKVVEAMDACAKDVKYGEIGELIDVVLSPPGKTGVFAKVDLEVNTLILVPFTTNIKFKETSPGKDAVLVATATLKALSGKQATLVLGKPSVQLPREQSSKAATASGAHKVDAVEGFVSPFWMVPEGAYINCCNMSMFKHRAENGTLLPCMGNIKAIKAGEKLLFAKKAPATARKILEQMESARPAKRARTT
jgi:hypothetical protein